MIRTAANKAEPSGSDQEYFFSGEMKYRPRTIKAKSREEAEKKWLLEREKVDHKTGRE